MPRYWAMGDLTRRARLQEQAKAALEAEMGIDPAALKQGQAYKRALHLDQMPTLEHGAPTEITARGEQYVVEGAVEGTGGDRVLYASRSVGGGRFEKVRIYEAREGEFTRVSADIKGGR